MSLTIGDCQWECLLPEEYRRAVAAAPVCFLPLGTVEWHGEHNALGLDALKAHALCVAAARQLGGGVVHPPLYGGMGGLDMPATVKIEAEHTWDNLVLRPWLERLLSELHRLEFKAIIMLTGHYGHNQQLVVRETAARMSERLQIPILGTPEYWLAHDAGYLGDHAGVGETSLLWHLHPGLVAMERITRDPVYGKTDHIRTHSSPALGQKYADLIVTRLATVARAMLGWEAATLAAFVAAERALVSAQVASWRRHASPWAAWRGLTRPENQSYGQLLADGDFTGIMALADRLASTASA